MNSRVTSKHNDLNRSTQDWHTPIVEMGSRWSFGKSGWINLMWSDLGKKPGYSIGRINSFVKAVVLEHEKRVGQIVRFLEEVSANKE
jgi:hypothetical protein